MSPRLLIGLSVASGLEGVDAAAVRAGGVGLDLAPHVEGAVRVAFPPSVRDVCKLAVGGSDSFRTPGPEFMRNIAETAVHAARQVLTRAGVSPRDTFALGLLEPAHAPAELGVPWPEVADRVAEQTGLTVLHGFRHRDRAAGGTGHPITAAADHLLFHFPSHARLLVHLGAATSLVLVPPGAKVSTVIGFEAGPGNQLLDALQFHGTRGKESSDPGGKKAVQGKCLEPLLARWLEHPHLTRVPPKAVHPEAFGRSFLLAAFDAARQLEAGLPDLLCTATHLAARALGDAARAWLPTLPAPRQVFATGGGVRNGFLWQLVSQQFAGEVVARADEAGVPALARKAAAAAVLAALTCDGVTGNLPVLTGATGGRLLGHIAPGDGRNWAKVAAWVADQTGEYPRVNRAA
jgi:anhydro-N-acetylmuramic acid kinase